MEPRIHTVGRFRDVPFVTRRVPVTCIKIIQGTLLVTKGTSPQMEEQNGIQKI